MIFDYLYIYWALNLFWYLSLLLLLIWLFITFIKLFRLIFTFKLVFVFAVTFWLFCIVCFWILLVSLLMFDSCSVSVHLLKHGITHSTKYYSSRNLIRHLLDDIGIFIKFIKFARPFWINDAYTVSKYIFLIQDSCIVKMSYPLDEIFKQTNNKQSLVEICRNILKAKYDR